jgi:phage shock protein C
MNAINIANIYLGTGILSMIAYYIGVNLYLIFWFFLLLGYLVLAIAFGMGKAVICAKEEVKMPKPAKKPEPGEIRRLYRSGKDRILGGVCGGIAEYLGVDPVIIRLLWIAGSLAWGVGILLYIICWIIIPRNPDHKWRD